MGPDNASSRETIDAPAWTFVGEVCARAVVAAILSGSLEATWIARASLATPAGFGLVMTGLWFPPMLALALAMNRAFATLSLFARGRLPTVAMTALYANVGAFLFFALTARTAIALPIRIAPLEVVAAVGATTMIAALRLDGIVRRSIAIAGIVSAIAVQLFASRWIDAHRAYVAVIGEHAMLPRLVLRLLFARAL